MPDKTTREDRKIDRTGLEFFISIVSIPAVLPVVSVKREEGSMRYQLGPCVLACFLTGLGLVGQQSLDVLKYESPK